MEQNTVIQQSDSFRQDKKIRKFSNFFSKLFGIVRQIVITTIFGQMVFQFLMLTLEIRRRCLVDIFKHRRDRRLLFLFSCNKGSHYLEWNGSLTIPRLTSSELICHALLGICWFVSELLEYNFCWKLKQLKLKFIE